MLYASTSLVMPGRVVGLATSQAGAPDRGLTKNCAIFPIASFWGLTIVALRKSEHESVWSNVKQINVLDIPYNRDVLCHDCFYAFRDKTTLERWRVSVWAIF